MKALEEGISWRSRSPDFTQSRFDTSKLTTQTWSCLVCSRVGILGKFVGVFCGECERECESLGSAEGYGSMDPQICPTCSNPWTSRSTCAGPRAPAGRSSSWCATSATAKRGSWPGSTGASVWDRGGPVRERRCIWGLQ